MWILFAIDFFISVAATILCSMALTITHEATPESLPELEALPLVSFLGRYLTATLIFQIIILVIMIFSLVYWTLIYRSLLATTNEGGNHITFNKWLQLLSIVVMALAYLFQFLIFGLSCTFEDISLHIHVNATQAFTATKQSELKSNLSGICVLLGLAIGFKTCQLILGHGWAVTKSDINAKRY